jgi:hypothetical protein
MQQDKPARYDGIDKDLYGGMTDPSRIIRHAWAFGLIPETETCAGWNAQAILMPLHAFAGEPCQYFDLRIRNVYHKGNDEFI